MYLCVFEIICNVNLRMILFSIYLIAPAVLGPGVYSASNSNEYEKQKKIFWLAERSLHIRLKTLQPSVSLLATHSAILTVPQSYWTPRPVTGIDLLLLFFMKGNCIGPNVRVSAISANSIRKILVSQI
jgi:hypothetical protein